MRFKAILFDFYGTLVEEADDFRVEICKRISKSCRKQASPGEIADAWYQFHPQLCQEAYGPSFRLQHDVAVASLQLVLQKFQCGLNTRDLMGVIRHYWTNPTLFPESKSVLKQCVIPMCIVSNIDDNFIEPALARHDLDFDHVITSESCRSYKTKAGDVLQGTFRPGIEMQRGSARWRLIFE
jgi:FMN phosphatase YigB (HAD superfamily)